MEPLGSGRRFSTGGTSGISAFWGACLYYEMDPTTRTPRKRHSCRLTLSGGSKEAVSLSLDPLFVTCLLWRLLEFIHSSWMKKHFGF